MPKLHVLRHVLLTHKPHGNEERDPGSDVLVVVHKNPNDPDDPTEFGHHIQLQGIAYRKEMWGTKDYASTIDLELKDLERYYHRREDVEYGVHPIADITQHYFEAPPARMQSFAPEYVMQRVMKSVMPATTDGVMRLCLETVASGIEDVKSCLASSEKKTFPCQGMTALSSDTVSKRSDVMDRMAEQTQQIELVPSKGLDEVRQFLTDRESELNDLREGFVNHALDSSHVPEIMRRRVVAHAVKEGLLGERAITWT